jgi:hypothetical protein
MSKSTLLFAPTSAVGGMQADVLAGRVAGCRPWAVRRCGRRRRPPATQSYYRSSYSTYNMFMTITDLLSTYMYLNKSAMRADPTLGASIVVQ